MADSLNAMTVRVQHESAVVAGMILWPQPRRTTVAPATGKRRRMKKASTAWRSGARKHKCARGIGVLISPSLVIVNSTPSEVRASVLSEVNDAYKHERA
jgi:hypothetical protein